MGVHAEIPPLRVFEIIICHHVWNEIIIIRPEGLATILLAVVHILLVVLLILTME